MSYKFNPFTSNLDNTGNSNTTWKSPVTDFASLPSTGNTDGDARVTLDTHDVYVWNGTTWLLDTGVTIGSFSNIASTKGLTITDASSLVMTAADATNPGGVSTTTQTFAGNKTFSGTIGASNFSGTSSGTNTGDVTLAAVGSSPSANGASLSGQALTLQPADGTHPGLVTSGTQTIGGDKTLSGNSTFSGTVTASTLNSAGVVHTDTNGLFSTSTIVNADISSSAGIVDTKLATIATAGKVSNSATTATSSNTNSTIVARDGSGNFSAGTITAALTGNATTATTATSFSGSLNGDVTGTQSVTAIAASVVTGKALTGFSTSAGTVSATDTILVGFNKLDGNIALKAPLANPTFTGTVTGTFSGNLTGNVTGTASGNSTKSAGDIDETSFTPSNNTSSAANVTGLAFANATVRSARILLSVYVNATGSLYEAFDLLAIQKGSSWEMAQASVGDASGYTFTITTAGQVQYTSTNVSGFTSAVIKFRAQTTTV